MQEQVKRVVHLHARPEAGKMETVLGSPTPVGKMLVNSNANVIKNEEELGMIANFRITSIPVGNLRSMGHLAP